MRNKGRTVENANHLILLYVFLCTENLEIVDVELFSKYILNILSCGKQLFPKV